VAAAGTDGAPGDIRIDSADAELDFEETRDDGAAACLYVGVPPRV
jgi:hypothetical protein